jgi:alkylhydroperoxidase/carboxymuconolactone decarboxylase family protein YurZ
MPSGERMVCTLAALSVLQRPAELKAMIGAVLDIGLAPRTVLEAFMQSGLYAGSARACRGHSAKVLSATTSPVRRLRMTSAPWSMASL